MSDFNKQIKIVVTVLEGNETMVNEERKRRNKYV